MSLESAILVERYMHVGLLIESYRDHIKAAYDLAKKMKEVGIERPWITVIEKKTPMQLGGQEINIDVEKRVRLEIR